MATYTDEQLKRVLAKMFPDRVVFLDDSFLQWDTFEKQSKVLDTQLLYLCSLVEETMATESEQEEYVGYLCGLTGNACWAHSRAPWQQRTIAAAKVKGVEIV